MDVATTLLLLLGLLLGGAGGFAAGRRAGDIRLATLASERDAATRERELLRQSEQAARERAALAEADVAGMRTALDYERRSATERLNLVEQSQQRLAESFQALSAQALESASRQFLDLASVRLQEAGTRAAGDFEQRRVAVEHLISPLREVLGKMEHRLADLETARIEAYATLVEQVRGVQQVSEGLRTQTAALVTALRKPQTRGAWGEMQLRRVAEVAGMIARCDFTEQPTITDGDGVRRPDMVVHLAGNRNIIVDAKVPLIAFLEASEAPDETIRDQRLSAHARHLRAHVDALGAKAYWRQFSASPEFVVLFVPAEAFLAPALEKDPALLEHAARKKVVIATPTTLIAMLRTVAHAWTQEALTTRTREIFELGRDLYTRLGTLGEHVDRLGRSIGRTVTDFNAAVGSLESRVLVPARRLAAMEVVDSVLATPARVESGVRALSAAELAGPAEAPPSSRLVR